jgi:amino acid transporter
VEPIQTLAAGQDALAAKVLASANHRNLNARQIRFTSFAGAIGAVLFVAIGSGVPNGPLPMLLGRSAQAGGGSQSSN